MTVEANLSPEGSPVNNKNFLHITLINILFLLAKLMHLFLSKKIFFLDFNTIPFKPYFLQSFNVLRPIVGKSIRKSCFFLGNLIKIPSDFFLILIAFFCSLSSFYS